MKWILIIVIMFAPEVDKPKENEPLKGNIPLNDDDENPFNLPKGDGKTCYKSKCSKMATNSCSCQDPAVYICDEHIIKHMRTPSVNQHIFDSLIIELKSTQKAELIEKIKSIQERMNQCTIDLIKDSKTIVECVEKTLKHNLNYLKQLELSFHSLLSQKVINKDTYEHILNSNFNFEFNSIEKVLKEIKEHCLLSQHLEGEFSELFINKYNSASIGKIDLNTLDFTPNSLNFRMNSNWTILRIEKDKLLCLDYLKKSNNRAFVYEITNKKETISNSGVPYAQNCGIVCKGDRVYLFGGSDSYGNLISTTTEIILADLKSKTMTQMPNASSNTSASLALDEIMVTGLNLDCAFKYKNNSFERILDLQANRPKNVIGQWVIDYPKLYELKKSGFSSYNLNGNLNVGIFFCLTTKFKGYIYIICRDTNGFYRINLKTKTVETLKNIFNKVS